MRTADASSGSMRIRAICARASRSAPSAVVSRAVPTPAPPTDVVSGDGSARPGTGLGAAPGGEDGDDHSDTNTQEAGVDEADLAETDGQYVYTLEGSNLVIVDATPADAMTVTSRTAFTGDAAGIYLHGTRLTVVSSEYSWRIRPVEGDAVAGQGSSSTGGSRTGGLVWRYQDALNYYAVQLNLAEQELSVYRVVRGNRIRLEREDDLELDPEAWHSLRVVQDGESMRVYLGGIRVFGDRDRSAREPGGAGLWASGDASVSFDDFVISERLYPNRKGQTYAITYNPKHHWYWFPRMRREEALVFKVYDSVKDGVARWTAHTAFEDPTSPPNARPRESIEIRTMAFF